MASAIGLLAVQSVQAGKTPPKTEEQVIAALASPNEDVVAEAMMTIEKKYPNSSAGVAEIKKYLGDNRAKVRRKAARVLGVLHADVTQAELDQICAMFKSSETREVTDALIALRGLKAQSVLPQIRDMLKDGRPNVLRDTCRTLAVLGSKDDIARIQPLTKSENSAVAKDARDAIFKLEAK